MKIKKLRGSTAVLLTAALASGIVLGTATAASAVGGGVVSCSPKKVSVQSNSSGRINHKEGVTVLGSWNNGSTFIYRNSKSGKTSVPSWEAFLSGSGGSILWASTHCEFT